MYHPSVLNSLDIFIAELEMAMFLIGRQRRRIMLAAKTASPEVREALYAKPRTFYDLERKLIVSEHEVLREFLSSFEQEVTDFIEETTNAENKSSNKSSQLR